MGFGLDPLTFEHMTPKQITDFIKAKMDKKREELRERAMFDYSHALNIAQFIGSMLDKDTKPIEIYELYPELFKEEKERASKLSLDNQINKLKAFVSSKGVERGKQ